MRKIYGAKQARANYVIWAAEELGLDYENIPVNPFDGSSKKPEYLAINPNGTIPTLDEDGFILWESMAINFYLARNYGDGILWSDDPHEEAMIFQWTFFVISEIEKHAVTLIIHKNILTEDQRSETVMAQCIETMTPKFKTLDDHLAGRDFLVGDRFSIADLNVAAILHYALRADYDFSAFKNLERWLNVQINRPARLKMFGKG